MTNKKIWLGMLVMVLVFGMTVVGCEDFVVDVEVTNDTNFTVTKVLLKDNSGTAQNDDTSGISPNSTKQFSVYSSYTGIVELSVSINNENVTVTNSLTVPNKSGSVVRYRLKGTNKTDIALEKK